MLNVKFTPLIFLINILIGYNIAFSTCDTCPLPRHPQTKAQPLDGTVDILFKENKAPIYGVTSVKRVTIKQFGKYIQGIKVFREINGICFDTVLTLDDVDKLFSSNLGIGGVTLNVPILPAKEYYFDQTKSSIKYNILSLITNIGYYGSDVSNRKIGTDGVAYSALIYLYPFKDTFGKKVKLGVGSGLFVENGRMRVPIFGSVRFNFMGGEYEEEYFNYFPSPCKFGIEGEMGITPKNPNLKEIPNKNQVDSTVYFFLDRRIIRDKYRPFIFLDGGLIFDTKFNGSGDEPSINKKEYNQYFVQVGIGIPLYDIIEISGGVSAYRLNLRTPCEACQDKFIVNSNYLIGAFLNFGIYFNY